MKYWKRLIGAVALVLSVCIYAVPAMALTCTQGSVTFSLDPASQVACFSGNDTNQISSAVQPFGHNDWILADKSDDTTSGNGNIFFIDAPTSKEASPAWTIGSTLSGFSSLLSGGNVMLTLKQGRAFGAFLITADSGTWGTSGPGKSVDALSHSSIYYRLDGDGGVSVPAPGSALLLALGIGLLGIGMSLRYRRG